MATYPVTRKWTVPASGYNSVVEIIANTDRDKWVTYMTIRADTDNAGRITWEDPQGEPGGYVDAGEAAIVGDDLGSVILKDYVFRGTAGDELYMTIGISAVQAVMYA